MNLSTDKIWISLIFEKVLSFVTGGKFGDKDVTAIIASGNFRLYFRRNSMVLCFISESIKITEVSTRIFLIKSSSFFFNLL